MNGNVIRTITIRGTSEGLDKLQTDLVKLAGAHKGVTLAMEEEEKSTHALEQAMKRQSLRLDEVARAQNNIARETKLADSLLKNKLIDDQRHAELLNLASQRYGTASKATQEFGKQTGLARHELINLGRQAQDVGVSLVSGQSPLMILAQQGSQIADVFISSGKSVGSFFSQAIEWATAFAKTPAGIVTGIVAIGGAAIYAASQFVRAQTTVEEALKEQIRLEKEVKTLIDARSSAEAKAQAQLKDQTQFEVKRNLLDLENKLIKAMEEAARIAERRSTRPAQVPGEMGEAPTAVSPLSDPGYARIAAASAALKTSTISLKEFNAELGRIGEAHPELAMVVEDVKAAGTEIENAKVRAQAWSDVLKGVATDAQHAALGLGSIAQKKLSDLRADETTAAIERMAQATLRMAAAYPGMSIEAAKQLNSLSGQLQMAQAIGPMAQIEVQYRQRLVELTDKLGPAEAARIAGMERAVSLAQIEAQHKQTMIQLQGQLDVASQVTGIGQINAQYEATVNLLSQQIPLSMALEQAELQRATAIANVNTQADHTLIQLRQEGEIIRANTEAQRESIRAEHTRQNLLAAGADSTKASAVAEQQLANARAKANNEEENGQRTQERSQQQQQVTTYAINNATDAWNLYNQGLISWSLAGQLATRVSEGLENQMKDSAIAAMRLSEALSDLYIHSLPLTRMAMTLMNPYEMGKTAWEKGGGLTQFNPAGYTSTTAFAPPPDVETQINRMMAGGDLQSAILQQIQGGITTKNDYLGMGGGKLDTEKVGIISRAIDLLPQQQQAGSIQALLGQASAAPPSLQTAELIKQLNDKLQQLTEATSENTSATSAMTDVLSPFYSSDPRSTHLGFRAFAGGGIMSQFGELPLRHYQGGGMATSPQVAVFGEGSTPEAYVPVPSGRIPVEIKTPANQNQRQRPVNVNIYVQGNADQNTVAAMKSTAFQQAQAMRRVMG